MQNILNTIILVAILLNLRQMRRNNSYAEMRVLASLAIIQSLLKPAEGSVVEFYVSIGGQLTKVKNMNLKVTQNLPVSISIKDKFGNDAAVDGAPVWALTAPDLADIEVAADGMSALVKPKGALGSCSLQVSADADLGAGVTTIMGELPIELMAGDAQSVSIAAGAPVDA